MCLICFVGCLANTKEHRNPMLFYLSMTGKRKKDSEIVLVCCDHCITKGYQLCQKQQSRVCPPASKPWLLTRLSALTCTQIRMIDTLWVRCRIELATSLTVSLDSRGRRTHVRADRRVGRCQSGSHRRRCTGRLRPATACVQVCSGRSPRLQPLRRRYLPAYAHTVSAGKISCDATWFLRT